MSKPEKVTALRPGGVAGTDDGAARLAVTLTVEELRRLIADTVLDSIANDDDRALLDVEGAATFLNQSRTFVYRYWRDMGGMKLGKNLRFSKAALKKWVASREGLT